ncbi:hypothetical protein K438DRAFT_1961339 [Mycena galopus ATCC 62051]|nr:hypothetical protein K438DRAFT_1961339 [Mycena galopus ATCC 62051]
MFELRKPALVVNTIWLSRRSTIGGIRPIMVLLDVCSQQEIKCILYAMTSVQKKKCTLCQCLRAIIGGVVGGLVVLGLIGGGHDADVPPAARTVAAARVHRDARRTRRGARSNGYARRDGWKDERIPRRPGGAGRV